VVHSQFINNRIMSRTVFLIHDNDPKQEISAVEARRLAVEEGLDLIEVGFNSEKNIPVCKIMDYGKYKYDQSKKEKSNRYSSKQHVTKEMIFRLRITTHDLDIKKNKVEAFISKGYSVKFGVELRGRERAFRKDAKDILESSLSSFSNIAKYDSVKETERSVFVMLNPV